MTELPSFNGFPPAALDFYVELAVNNNREWFNPRKEYYKETVLQPALSFVVEFGEELKKMNPAYAYGLKTNGSGSVMRIYRDTRFSKDKSPYKSNLGIGFWQGERSNLDHLPGYYFHYSPKESWLLCGFHMFSKEFMAAYRLSVVDEILGPELVDIIDKLTSRKGFEVGGERYKRVPVGFDKEHPRAELLLNKTLWAASPDLTREQLTGPDLVETLSGYARTMEPLNLWLAKVGRKVKE